MLISAATLACALPFDVAGIVLLRLIKDMEDIHLDDVTLAAFKEARFPNIEAYLPPPHERANLRKRRARIALVYAVAIAALCVTGVSAALWHMRPWVAACFAATVALSAFKGVRTFELRQRSDGTTDFTMTERFFGLMLPIVKRSFPDFGDP